MKHNSKLERVQVSVRIRPFSNEEKLKNPNNVISSIDQKTNTLTAKKDYDIKTFTFDNIYPINSKQDDIFNYSSQEVVKSVLKGYNGTIFAYGQTGTGKTYTMVGDFFDNGLKGIIPRSFDFMFEEINKDSHHKYNISISFIQIYLETIQDLLEPRNKEIRIREDPDKGVYLEGVQWVQVTSTEECGKIFQIGEKNRVTESTLMNAHSSRSHAILIAKIEKNIILSQEQIKQLSKESNEKIKSERVMTHSHLYLVDLAGSERVKKTKAENIRLEEAKKINYSLLILGNCIQSLTENKGKIGHVSYRDSKLTRLLQESLGGNAKTSLIVTVSPSAYNLDETFSSLNFASRAMKVQNKPIINKSVDYQALCIKLQEDLDKLTDEFSALKIEYDKLNDKYEKLKNGETKLEDQRKGMMEKLGEKGVGLSSESQISQKEKEAFQQQMKKLEKFYQELLKNKTNEYENILKDIDKILLEKETSIENLLKSNKKLNLTINDNNETIADLKKEKEDLMSSVNDLSNKLEFERTKNSGKSSDDYKAELEKLNEQVEELEKKIVPLENANSLNDDSVNKYQQKLNHLIKSLKEEKISLNKDKSNNLIQISQNDIKKKIFTDEILKIQNKQKNCTEDMKNVLENCILDIENELEGKKKENEVLVKNQKNYIERISDLDKEISLYNELKENLNNLKNEEVRNMDKTTILCGSKLNEIIANLRETTARNIKEEYEKLLKEMRAVIITNNQLNKENISYKKKLNDLNAKVAKMIKESNITNSVKEQHSAMVNNDKIGELKVKIEELNGINLKLAKALDEKDKEIDTLKEETNKFKMDKNFNEIIRLEKKTDECSRKINGSINKEEDNDLKAQIKELKKKLNLYKSELTDKATENEELHKRIKKE